VLRDMNSESNAELRSDEILQYLKALLNSVDRDLSGSITRNGLWSMQLTPVLVPALKALGAARRQAGRLKEMSEVSNARDAETCFGDNERSAATLPQECQKQSVGRAEELSTHTDPICVNSELAQQASTWDTFTIKDRLVSLHGTQHIEWKGERWLKVRRTGDLRFVTSMDDRPLLSLTKFRAERGHHECQVARYADGSEAAPTPVCTLVRTRDLVYSVELAGPSPRLTIKHRGVDALDIVQSDLLVCRIQRRAPSELFSTHSDGFYVYARGSTDDKLLYLALAAAIVRDTA